MIDFMDSIGWIGNLMLAFCGMPQAYRSFKMKNSDGLEWSFLLLWTFGLFFAFCYALTKNDVLPLLFNYFVSILFNLIIIYFKLFPKKS